MKLNSLTLAVALTTIVPTYTFAAALDRSGQSISAFLQAGNYAEASITSLQPTVEGQDTSGNAIPDLGETYNFWNAAIKVQPTDSFSFGLIFDEPFGAAAHYRGDNNFVAQPGQRFATSTFGANAPLNSALGISGSTYADVKSRSITALAGFKPVPATTLYGGLVYEEAEGEVSLRGAAYGPLSGYDLDIEKDGAFGWLAGAAYEIPEIALKASLTYRSEIEHKINTHESFALGNAARATVAGINQNLAAAGVTNLTQSLTAVTTGLTTVNSNLAAVNAGLQATPGNATLLAQQQQLLQAQTQLATQQATLTGAQSALQALAAPATLPSSVDGQTTITTPQSVNLEFQTGIMADTLAFANVRWVDWSEYSVQPTLFSKTTNGLNIVEYSDDQWSANLGLGRKLTDTWSGNISVGWDSGAGNPVTTLGPVEGYWSAGLGVRYAPTPQVELSGGVKYFWLGDAQAQVSTGGIVGDFQDNEALAVGLKLGYHF